MLSPSTKDIIAIIRSYAYKNGLSMSDFAQKAGVSKAWISKMKNEDREISLHIAEQLLEASGYKLIVKHQSQISESDKADIKLVEKGELDRKDKENLEVNRLIDKNKKILDHQNADQKHIDEQKAQQNKSEASSRLRKMVKKNV